MSSPTDGCSGLTPGPSTDAAASGSVTRLFVMAEINLSSRQRYRKWHHWLEKLDIKQKHVPTPGAEELVMPPVENRGKRAYRNCVVELRGLESAITTMIERFKSDGSLIRVWDPGAGHRRRSP